MRARTRSQVIGLVEQVTGLGMRVGIPLVVVATIYLLAAAFGRTIHEMPKMPAGDRARFVETIQLAMTVLTYAGAVSIFSIIIRLFYDEVVGQVLSLFGALLYFGSAPFFALFGAREALNPESLAVFGSIASEFRVLGVVCLLPGLCLVLRDAMLRIWTGVSVRRVVERRWGDEEERRKKFKPKVYGSCWDMPFCRDFVRRVCPAYQAKRPCWRLKVGCYCDERTILQAMTSYGTDNEHMRGIMHSLGLDKPHNAQLSGAQKRARCRRCGIFSEHQRQKYKILSPAVFPVVGLLLYLFYDKLAAQVSIVLAKTDEIMSFLAYRPGSAGQSLSQDQHVLTTLAMIWLAIVVVSYALRALEYAIFELQV